MRVEIAVVTADRQAEIVAVRLIERALRHLDYPVSVGTTQPDPTNAEMANLVADARANGLSFRIV